MCAPLHFSSLGGGLDRDVFSCPREPVPDVAAPLARTTTTPRPSRRRRRRRSRHRHPITPTATPPNQESSAIGRVLRWSGRRRRRRRPPSGTTTWPVPAKLTSCTSRRLAGKLGRTSSGGSPANSGRQIRRARRSLTRLVSGRERHDGICCRLLRWSGPRGSAAN